MCHSRMELVMRLWEAHLHINSSSVSDSLEFCSAIDDILHNCWSVDCGPSGKMPGINVQNFHMCSLVTFAMSAHTNWCDSDVSDV